MILTQVQIAIYITPHHASPTLDSQYKAVLQSSGATPDFATVAKAPAWTICGSISVCCGARDYDFTKQDTGSFQCPLLITVKRFFW